MKKVFLLLFVPFHLFSQDISSNRNSISKLKALSNSESTIIKEELTNLGRIANKYYVNLVTLTDLDKHNSTSGIKFIIPEKPWGAIGYSSYADEDEIGGLLKFLDFVKVLSSPVSKRTEYNYSTSGNFRVSAVFEVSESQWTKGVFIDKNYSESYVELDSKEFLAFYQILVSAKSNLGK